MLAIVLAFAWLPAAGAQCVEHASRRPTCARHGAAGVAGAAGASSDASHGGTHTGCKPAHTCCIARAGCNATLTAEPAPFDCSLVPTACALPQNSLRVPVRLSGERPTFLIASPPLYLRNASLLL